MADTKISALDTTNTNALRAKVLTPRGALVGLTADTATTLNLTGGYVLPWTREMYDTDSIHDNTTNNTRLTVPSGITWVRMRAVISFAASVDVNAAVGLFIAKNGVLPYDGAGRQQIGNGAYSNPAIFAQSAPLSVVAGDYFETKLWSTDSALGIATNGTWFEMEILA